jgi:urease gamma subunit
MIRPTQLRTAMVVPSSVRLLLKQLQLE